MKSEPSKKTRNRRGCGNLFQKAKGGNWHMKYYRPNPETDTSECVRECAWTTDRTSAQKMLNERLVQIARGELFEVGKRVTVAKLYEALQTATKNNNPRPRAAKGSGWRWKPPAILRPRIRRRRNYGKDRTVQARAPKGRRYPCHRQLRAGRAAPPAGSFPR